MNQIKKNKTQLITDEAQLVTAKKIYSVTEITEKIKYTIEQSFSIVQISGEISGLKNSNANHTYFNIKDEKNIIFCTIWSFNQKKILINLAEGQKVIVTGKITTYGGASRYQINVLAMSYQGVGELLQQFENLKIKLKHLFNQKRPIPKYPTHLGIVTSETGAVLKDILHRIRDRYPIKITLAPCAVQGKFAVKEICESIQKLQNLDLDLIIIARGGGSVEDLWCFNDETLAQAIFDSAIPTISAIGHETDITICDFVADLRAPTPTAASELATPDKKELLKRLFITKNNIFINYELIIKNKINSFELLKNKIKYNTSYLNFIQKLEILKEKLINFSAQNKIANINSQFLLHTNNIFSNYIKRNHIILNSIKMKYELQYNTIQNFIEQPKNNILNFIKKNKITYITNSKKKIITSVKNLPEEMYIHFTDGSAKVKKLS